MLAGLGSDRDTLTGGAGNDSFFIGVTGTIEGGTEATGAAADTITDFAAGDLIFLKGGAIGFGGTFAYTAGSNFAAGADIVSAGTDLGASGQIAVNTTDGRVFLSGFLGGSIPVVVLQPNAPVSFIDFSFF